MEDGISLIMEDEIDWETLLGPQYIVGINRELIPVYIGHLLNSFSNDVDTSERAVGIWVKTTDYHKINHESFYVFIHDYEISEKELNEIMDNLEKDTVGYIIDEINQLNRSHYHIGINIDEQLEGYGKSNYLH